MQKTCVEGKGILYLHKTPFDYLLSPMGRFHWNTGLFRKRNSLLPEPLPHFQNSKDLVKFLRHHNFSDHISIEKFLTMLVPGPDGRTEG